MFANIRPSPGPPNSVTSTENGTGLRVAARRGQPQRAVRRQELSSRLGERDVSAWLRSNGTQHVAAAARARRRRFRNGAPAARGHGRPTAGPSGRRDRLLRRYAETGDPALKEELVRRFLPLARSLALRYRGASEQLEDLIQVASLGLVKALDGFDLERGQVVHRLRGADDPGRASPPLPRPGLGGSPAAGAPGADDGGQRGGRRAQRRARSDSHRVPDRRRAWTWTTRRSRRPCRPTRRVARCRSTCREAGEDRESVPMVETVGRDRARLRRGGGPARRRGGPARRARARACSGSASRRT